MRWLRREIGTKRPERVGGHAFFERAIAVSVDHGLNHYFMGSTPDTLEKLEKTLLARFPRIHIVGKSSPPYKEHTASDYEHELQKIRAAKPDIVWVGLGTPRQDQAASYMATRYPAVFACVGAVFDFTAGNLRDAPNWMQEAGLAWLFRFIQEPRRLFYRYTYGNAKFIKIAMNQMRANRSA
jgi:N-acetylglucosaminyldiphosphoundecaprenol N-acetyl-beta-D-mannosaminyltransferase